MELSPPPRVWSALTESSALPEDEDEVASCNVELIITDDQAGARPVFGCIGFWLVYHKG